jgi:TfdA family taurine catabolism dioxygenase TauD
MNVHAPILDGQIDLSVSRAELTEFERVTASMNVAESALGQPAVQKQLRECMLDIFSGISLAIYAGKQLAAARNASRRPQYYVIRGLRVHELRYSQERDVRGSFVVGLSSFWGNPSLGNYHQPDASFAYRHIKARRIEEGEPLSLLNSVRDGFPHTDSAFKREPEPLFALFTVRAAPDGGDSLVWNVAAVIEWIGSRPNGAEVIELMREKPFPFVGSVLEPERVIHAPILLDRSGERIRYKRDAIEDGAKALGREVSPEELLVMDALDAATECPDLTERFSLGDGDAVVLDNQRTLHSRTPFRDESRHLLKTTMVY